MTIATKKLSELANIFYGASPATIRVENSDIPIFGTSGLVGYASKPLFETEAIVVGRKGTLGNPIFTPDKFWAIDTTYAVIAKDDVDTKWLYYALLHHDLTRLNEATGVPSINRDRLYNIDITYFEYPEQRVIADILSTLDEAIAQSESLVRKYQSIKQGLMSDLLTRGMDENGELRDSKDFTETQIGNFPKTWTIISLGEIISKSGGFIQTGPFGSQLHSYEYVEQGVPVVMPQDIMEDGRISEDNIARITAGKAKELSRHIVKPNDVVFARRGDLSRCSAITEQEAGWLCGTGSMLVRPSQKEIDGRWLAAVYRHEIGQHQIRARAVGSTMVNLNSTLLRDLVIPKPPLPEQEKIMEILESQDGLLRTEVESLAKLQLLKQGLMQDLLSGQVRVKV